MIVCKTELELRKLTEPGTRYILSSPTAIVLSIGDSHGILAPDREVAVNLTSFALGCWNNVSMPSEEPISGFALAGLVGVDAFAGSVNDRPVVAMRLGVSSGVAGPGDEAMLSNTSSMGVRTKWDVQ